MLSNNLRIMLNDQIGHELLNANKYRVCKAWFRREGYEGFANFFDKNYKDELIHAEWIQEFLENRNASVDIPVIEAVGMTFRSVEEIADFTLLTEQQTTEKLKAIMEQADEDDDYMVEELIYRMIKEQVEEEDKAQTFVDLVSKCCDDTGLLVVDGRYA